MDKHSGLLSCSKFVKQVLYTGHKVSFMVYNKQKTRQNIQPLQYNTKRTKMKQNLRYEMKIIDIRFFIIKHVFYRKFYLKIIHKKYTESITTSKQ